MVVCNAGRSQFCAFFPVWPNASSSNISAFGPAMLVGISASNGKHGRAFGEQSSTFPSRQRSECAGVIGEEVSSGKTGDKDQWRPCKAPNCWTLRSLSCLRNLDFQLMDNACKFRAIKITYLAAFFVKALHSNLCYGPATAVVFSSISEQYV